MIASNRAQMLADMGVQVWYARSNSPAPTEPVQPSLVQSESAQARLADTGEVGQLPDEQLQHNVAMDPPGRSADGQIDPIALHWARGRAGLLLFATQPDEALEILAADIVRALDWRYADQDQQAAVDPTLGEFKWPQLLSSTGTPARSLRALLSKHLPEEGWLGLTPDAAEQVEPWLKLAPNIDVYNLVDVRSALDEPDVKRVLWQQISNH